MRQLEKVEEKQTEGGNLNTGKQLFERTGFDISVIDVVKSYRIGEEMFNALNGVTCSMPSGNVTVIQGPSGCGKTTLMNLLGGVDILDSGKVLVGSDELIKTTDESWLSRYRLNDVGFIFQAFNLIPGLTAFDNLQLPMTVAGMSAAERKERGHALLDLVGMRQKADKRPDELSGGEQQRVAIALALVNDPPLILADEPTGNLDSTNAMIVTDLLCELAHKSGKTVAIATHDSMVGERGDQRLYMRDGGFVEATV
ncbi:MAG: putative ABC transport system ATP-binding protein [Bacteroidia bacterium]